MKIAAILLTLFTLNACGNSKSITNMQDTSNANIVETLSGKYLVSSFSEKTTDLPDGIYLDFDNATKTVSGFAGCNQFSGKYTIDKNTITFSPLRATKKYCRSTMKVEQALFSALNKVSHFSIKNKVLHLMEDNKSLITATKKTSSKTTALANFIIDYNTQSRGGFKHIILKNKTVSVQTGHNTNPNVKTCSDKNWNALGTLLNNTNLKEIANLEPPTKAHQYDGAPMANLTITKDGTVYQLKPFDAGNPLKAVSELVNLTLNIAN